jgi:Flp pilus assembly pilin Flp
MKMLIKKLRSDTRGASEFAQSVVLLTVVALGAIVGALLLRDGLTTKYTTLGTDVQGIGNGYTLTR